MTSTADKLKNWLHNQKDSSVSFVLEKMLRKKLAPFGELAEFQLNSRARSALLKVLLKGETDLVAVFVDEYEVSSGAGGSWITVRKARASREWITRLLTDFLAGHPLPIPEQYASVVRMLL